MNSGMIRRTPFEVTSRKGHFKTKSTSKIKAIHNAAARVAI